MGATKAWGLVNPLGYETMGMVGMFTLYVALIGGASYLGYKHGNKTPAVAPVAPTTETLAVYKVVNASGDEFTSKDTKFHIVKTDEEETVYQLPEMQRAYDGMKMLEARYEEQEKANKPVEQDPEPKKDGEKDGKKEKAEEAGSNAGLIIVLCIVGALAIAGALWFFVFRSSEEDEELNADDCAVHEEC